MKITVKTHHVNITVALKAYAEKKLLKLDRYFDHVLSVSAELNQSDTASDDSRCVAEIVAKVSGAVIRAEHVSADMYASIDGVYEKMVIQLKKHKEKLRSHKRDSTQRSVSVSEVKKAPKKSTQDKILYVTKPMTAEDALSFLEEAGGPFLMFKNIETEVINVIYPLDKKGEYGVIEAC